MIWCFLSLLLVQPAPAADLCPKSAQVDLLPGTYGGFVLMTHLLIAKSPGSTFRVQISLSGKLHAEVGPAGILRTATVKANYSIIYDTHAPAGFRSEMGTGSFVLGPVATRGQFQLAGTIQENARGQAVPVPQKVVLSIELQKTDCGTAAGIASSAFVQALVQKFERMGSQVTVKDMGGTYLRMESGDYLLKKNRVETLVAGIFGQYPSSSEDLDWDQRHKDLAGTARGISSILLLEKIPSMRTCLAANYRNSVNQFVENHSYPLLLLLNTESLHPALLLQSAKAVPGLLQWLNSFASAGLETCSERVQNLLFEALRKKLFQVIDYSLQHQITAGDLTKVFTRVPLAGAVSIGKSGQVSTVVKAYGRERILEALSGIKSLRAPQDLCLSEVDRAWTRAQSVERIVNSLTGSTYTDVSAYQLKIIPGKANCP